MDISKAFIVNPDEIQCTLQFTMNLEDWKQIRTTLNRNPAYVELHIITAITDLVYQLEKTLCSYKPEVDDET